MENRFLENLLKTFPSYCPNVNRLRIDQLLRRKDWMYSVCYFRETQSKICVKYLGETNIKKLKYV